MQTINLVVPKGWHELSQKQLKYVFFLISENYTYTQLKTLCLFRWTNINVISQFKEQWWVKMNKKKFCLTALQVAEALTSLEWLEEIPSRPVRLDFIQGHCALRADFLGVPFETFIVCENLYQGFLHTRNKDLLRQLAAVLYKEKKISPNLSELTSVFYWFASLKRMFSLRFPNFYKEVGNQNENTLGDSRPFGVILENAMNTQIRALTKGDISKEQKILSLDTWRALTELDAQAKEYDEMKRLYKNGNTSL